LPAFNEAGAIGGCLKALAGRGNIFVYDNNSTDDTATIAREHGAQVVTSPEPGYEAVVYHIARDFLTSNDEVLCILDGDGEVGLKELPAALGLLPGCDGVVGVRARPKRIAERLVNRLFYSKVGVKDVYCGFKVLHKSGISASLPTGTFSTGLLNKQSQFRNLDVKIVSREGSRLGSVIRTNVNIFLGGLKGFLSN
jgi:glycosyltransferase involved in cell wall biosynthesis